MAPLVREYLQDLGVNGKATVIGSNMKAPARFAAFANGVAIHADDFDDTQLAVAKDRVYGLLTHPTVTAASAGLRRLRTRAARTARSSCWPITWAWKSRSKIAEAIIPRHYDDGFHTTGTCGSFGSAAACAKLRGLNAGRPPTRSRRRGAEGWRLARKFRLHDQALSRRPCRGKRNRRRRPSRPGLDRRPDILEGAAGIFSGRRRRLRSRRRSSTGSANPGPSLRPAFPSSLFLRVRSPIRPWANGSP